MLPNPAIEDEHLRALEHVYENNRKIDELRRENGMLQAKLLGKTGPQPWTPERTTPWFSTAGYPRIPATYRQSSVSVDKDATEHRLTNGNDASVSGRTEVNVDKPIVVVAKRKMNRWLRLILCWATSAVLAGLIPGQALFIQMFMDFGLNKSACPDGQWPCMGQQLKTATAFNMGALFSYMLLLPFGWFFDRYGAARVCVWGAMACWFGIFLLLIPLFSVLAGYDAYTGWLVPFCICFSDCGSMGAAYACLGMVYHFPERQSVVLAFWSSASLVAPALLPNALQGVMEYTGMNLPCTFICYVIFQILCTILLYFVVPSREEFLEEAAKTLGGPMPEQTKALSLCQDVKSGLRTLRKNCRTHCFYNLSMTSMTCAFSMYVDIMGTYEDMLLGAGAGDYMTSIQTLIMGTFGSFVLAIAGYVTDEFGSRSLLALFMMLLAIMCCSTVLVGGATWFQQIACISLMASTGGIGYQVGGKYCIQFCAPSQAGVVIGTMGVISLANGTIIFTTLFTIMSIIPADLIPRYMTFIFGMATVGMGIFVVHFSSIKLPSSRDFSPEDVEEDEGEYRIGDVVECLREESEGWQKGVLTSVQPLLVKPKGFDKAVECKRVRRAKAKFGDNISASSSGSSQERRLFADGGEYTKQEIITYFGEELGLKYWNMAAPRDGHKIRNQADPDSTADKAIKAGALIEALVDTKSDSEPPRSITKGTIGRVVVIDKDGDAKIYFDGLTNPTWILAKNSANFKVLQQAQNWDNVSASSHGSQEEFVVGQEVSYANCRGVTIQSILANGKYEISVPGVGTLVVEHSELNEERRRFQDGGRYTKQEIIAYFGEELGSQYWHAAAPRDDQERRLFQDGGKYTKQEIITYFGEELGLKYWNMAAPRDGHPVSTADKVAIEVEPAIAKQKRFPAQRIGKWPRVTLCFLTSALVAGLLPGQAMFIQMFVEFGVNSSLCKDGELSPCIAQQIATSSGFNIGFALSVLLFLLSGWLFDRYGARKVCLWGAVVTCIGVGLLEIPLLSVAYGNDASTSWLLPIIITFTDSGAMCSAYAVMGMVYHFPGKQTLILALWSCAAQVAPALLPNAVVAWMRLTGMDLPATFGVYAIVIIVSMAVMYVIVPSQEEYFEEATECLGLPMPDPSEKPTMWEGFKRGARVARYHSADHIWFTIGTGTLFAAYNMYMSVLGTYEDRLLGFAGAGDYLTYMNTLLQGSCGTVVVVCLGLAIDKAGNRALVLLFATEVLLLLLMTVFVAGATWFSQMSCIVVAVILNSCLFPLMARYAITYCLPMQVGVFVGVLYTAAIVVFVVEMICYYALLSFLPSYDMPTLMSSIFGIATAVMGAYVARFACTKLPDFPVFLPEDEDMICEPFGCRTFEEALYVLHMEPEDKPELLRLLGKPTKENVKELESRYDVMRSWMLSPQTDKPGELDLHKILPAIFSFVPPHPRR